MYAKHTLDAMTGRPELRQDKYTGRWTLALRSKAYTLEMEVDHHFANEDDSYEYHIKLHVDGEEYILMDEETYEDALDHLRNTEEDEYEVAGWKEGCLTYAEAADRFGFRVEFIILHLLRCWDSVKLICNPAICNP